MGVHEVQLLLRDVFPQVDNRVLRAVAFAHANDADSAVESVLTEVIPFLSKDMTKSSSSNVRWSHSEGATVTDMSNATFLLESVHEPLKYAEIGGSSRFMSSSISSEESEDEGATSLRKGKSEARNDESLPSRSLEHRKVGASVKLSDWEDSDKSLLSVNGAILKDDAPSKTLPREGKSKSRCDDLTLSNSLANGEVGACAIIHDLVDSDKSLLSSGAILEEQLCENVFPLEANSTVEECMENSQESNSQLGSVPDTQVTVFEEQEASTIMAFSKNDLSNCEMVDLHDESTMNTMVSRPGYICSIDILEDLIEEARNNKKILVSAMDSVISLAREVEVQEKAAEEARMEASRGRVDVHNKVQELKLALKRAKEANEMHVGEVYAEKAVLNTEAKELQSRLLSLSEERDRSLKVLDEMRESLEVRMNRAQKEIEEALQEKLEKEASAREELAIQERIMEEVVQESRLLKQEAEENSKLQDFLMDRGRVVDMLQGEISVKCQDVKLLKEKFDSRVPLSTSLLSSFGSLSRSSSRSMSPPLHVLKLGDSCEKLQKSEELVDSFDALQTLERGAQIADSAEAIQSSFTTPNYEHLFHEAKKAGDDSKMLVDDGWNLL